MKKKVRKKSVCTAKRVHSFSKIHNRSSLDPSNKISQYAIIGLLVLLFAVMYPIIKTFLIPILLAATFTTLFYPLYTRLLLLFHNNQPLSAFVSCIVLLISCIVPIYVVMHLIVLELFKFYQSVEPVLKDTVTFGSDSQLFKRVNGLIPKEILTMYGSNIVTILNNIIKSTASVASNVLNRTSTSFFNLLTTIVIMFFTMFYFFMDGEKLLKKIKFLSPVRDDYEDLIFSRFLLISRATVLGTLIIGVIQGMLGAVTLLVFGVHSWLLWGFAMVFLSIIPMVGAWSILLPAAVFQIVNGHIWQGIVIALICMVIISNIDNLIRPRLVGKGAKLHDLVIFFSSLGGIAAFGVMGFIIGPVISALFISVLDIYSIEFEKQLEAANRPGP